jgi:hypothetical protein
MDLDKHVLTFSCQKEACKHEQRTIEAGDRDQSIDVALQILPAKLKVIGNPGSTYSSPDDPNLPIGTTTDALVPMNAGLRVFHVIELPSKRELEKNLSPNAETVFDFTKSAGSP